VESLVQALLQDICWCCRPLLLLLLLSLDVTSPLLATRCLIAGVGIYLVPDDTFYIFFRREQKDVMEGERAGKKYCAWWPSIVDLF
jgi:hypothetical protein